MLICPLSIPNVFRNHRNQSGRLICKNGLLIYPVDSVIHPLNNWGHKYSKYSHVQLLLLIHIDYFMVGECVRFYSRVVKDRVNARVSEANE